MFLAGFALSVTMPLGAPYPGAAMLGAADRQKCMTSYRLKTADSLDRVAGFYAAEASAAHTPLVADTGAGSKNYRTLVFISQPRYLSIVLSRDGGETSVRVRFHLDRPAGCS
ncbi:hypothetical protein [Sphingomonas sp.]|uniref:hypothetical protein n=1 Tax=Sphingomonas sp. TaxID=28214 RepID=UPI001B05F39F|nr:hypothetical protein [Sphingomonas sp.]MBO9711701.1 hypothetical protein [Sphingomonas sp.]